MLLKLIKKFQLIWKQKAYLPTKLKISDRVECIARAPAFMTHKDGKCNFHSNPMCCLINPSKRELGKVSNQLVEKINSDIIDKL